MIGLQSGSDVFKYLSPFGWMDMTKVVAGTLGLWWLWYAVFIAISVASFTAALYIFERKQLSI